MLKLRTKTAVIEFTEFGGAIEFVYVLPCLPWDLPSFMKLSMRNFETERRHSNTNSTICPNYAINSLILFLSEMEKYETGVKPIEIHKTI